MTRSKKLRVLREIYAQVPEVNCRGLCVAHCTTVPAWPIEIEELQRAIGRELPTIPLPRGGASAIGEVAKTCPVLVLGRCNAYEARPLICRVFGAAVGLPCPYGCAAEKPLTEREVGALFTRIEEL